MTGQGNLFHLCTKAGAEICCSGSELSDVTPGQNLLDLIVIGHVHPTDPQHGYHWRTEPYKQHFRKLGSILNIMWGPEHIQVGTVPTAGKPKITPI